LFEEAETLRPLWATLNQAHHMRVYLDINTITPPAQRVRSSANSRR